MNFVKPTSGRNETMDICKFIGSLFVVWIHVPFPGNVGGAVDCIARFAVPMFFAISGWFSYQADSKKLRKRMWHIFTLYAAGLGLGAALGAVTWLYNGNNLMEYLSWFSIDAERICKILFLCDNPFYNSPELWYLLSIGQTYLAVSLYVQFFKDRQIRYLPLYGTAFVLLLIHVVLGTLAMAAGMEIPAGICRNGLLFALPLFTVGLFLHQYHERIVSVFGFTCSRMLLLILGGLVLSLIQWRGVGIGEMPLGMLLTAPALVLLMTSYPTLPAIPQGLRKLVAKLGTISMVVYIIHFPLIGIYETFLQETVYAVAGQGEAWIKPVAVAFLSVVVGLLWDMLLGLWKRNRAH